MIQQRVCKQCGATFTGGPRAYYCHACRTERQREQSRLCNQRRRAGITRQLGSNDNCERCGKQYIVNGAHQRFCLDCKPIHTTEYDRATSLEFYHANANKINPPRNERRRIGLVSCKWCGNEFNPGHTRRIYCSPECKRLHKNKDWMDKQYPKRKHKYCDTCREG